MREKISVLFAFLLFLVVLFLISSGRVILPDYWTGLAVGLSIALLGVLYYGFKPRINQFLKKTPLKQKDKVEPIQNYKWGIEEQSKILPDNSDITELVIDNKFLDQLYENAQGQAVELFHDAQLCTFTVQVFPYSPGLHRVNLYFEFYELR